MGCRLNFAESEAMRLLAGGEDDLIIVNSCAVTSEAVRQTRQAIRRAKRARPEARVMVTGCAAQIEPDMFAAMPEVERVLGNREKFESSLFRRRPESQDCSSTEPFPAEIPAFAGMTEKVRVSNIMRRPRDGAASRPWLSDRSRAFVEVQNGCDHRCTFCIIPFGRGNSRSVPAGPVVERIKALVDEGSRKWC
jgi:threonylcarbamoyladenosine tRNA methylthiotransferase MtaB